jgi:hypothetical protein
MQLNTPISTTAPIDPKTHVWPIDGIAQWLTNQWSLLGYPCKNIHFLICCRRIEHRVNNNKCVIDTHIILVLIVPSNQNSCIKYSTQDQHFAEMFTYSDNTNYNLNFYCFIVSIQLRFHLFGNYSCIWWQWWNFRVPSTAPSFVETPEFAPSVAVVDMRRVLRVWETTARGV